ncbi:MAG: pyridoxal-phosphate dependent enzyme [Patescibacteria group bacterium]
MSGHALDTLSNLTLESMHAGTPILALRHGIPSGSDVFAKLEFFSLTGSVKDRIVSCEMSKAISLGYRGMAIASTGNMATSTAAFSNIWGFPCQIFMPAGTATEKLRMVQSFGVTATLVDGDYEAAVVVARQYAKRYNYFFGGLSKYRFEGFKAIGHEIAALEFDNVVIPIGDGTTFVGTWMGAKERCGELGLPMPRFIGVRYGDEGVQAIAIDHPYDINQCNIAVEETGGAILTSTQTDLERARKTMYSNGIYAEDVACLTLGPILDGMCRGKTLCLITGTALKNNA